ncbi:hypothetical protein HQ46_09260 [Porphyromonas gulae]|nr:hypothetical protein HQ46_09260 [Porphyromonas gulae]
MFKECTKVYRISAFLACFWAQKCKEGRVHLSLNAWPNVDPYVQRHRYNESEETDSRCGIGNYIIFAARSTTVVAEVVIV